MCPACGHPLPAQGRSLASLLRPQGGPAATLTAPPASMQAAAPALQPDTPAAAFTAASPASDEPPGHRPGPPTPTPQDDAGFPPVEQAPAMADADTRAPVPAAPAEGPVQALPDSAAPSFVQRALPPALPLHADRGFAVAAALLALVLGLQLLLASRTELATHAGWRPLLERTCAVLRCSLPPWRQPQAFSMLARDVQAAPGMPGVLEVSAAFRNDARWPQPWPDLRVSLSDADGARIGARVLRPQDYLEAGEANALLAPGQSARMAVRVRAPGSEAVAFSFEFQ